MGFFKRFFDSNTAAVVCLLFTMLLFGFSFMFSSIALNSSSTFSLLSWRFFTAFFFMTLLRVFGVIKIELKGLPISLLWIGLFHPVVYFVFETLGISKTSVAESGIIISLVPVVSMILAASFLKEHPTFLQILSVILAVLGTVIVTLGSGASSLTFNKLGYLALFGAVFSGALFFVVSRKVANYSSATKSYVMMGMGCVIFTSIALVEHILKGTVSNWLTLPFKNPVFLVAILYLGLLASVLGSLALNYAVVRIGVHRTSASTAITSAVSILAGVLILREPFTLKQCVGAVIILLGVTGVNQFSRK